MPLDSPVRVTQWYGENPDYYRQFGLAGHGGIDFGVVVGTPVKAVSAGRVTRVQQLSDGYGWHVYVNHGWSQSLYAHLSRIDVAEQQDVSEGQQIGLSGNTGNSTGPHLHFGMRIYGQGTPAMNLWIDPAYILGLKGQPEVNVQGLIGTEAQKHVLPLNPVTAFERAGAALGRLPASREFDTEIDGTVYRAQVYRDPAKRDRQYIVYCVVNQWDLLTWFERAN